MRSNLIWSSAIALSLVISSFGYAQEVVIDFTNSAGASGTTGELLNGITLPSLPSAAIDVPEAAEFGLTLTVQSGTSISETPTPTLFSNAGSLGISSNGGNSNQFDSGQQETIVISFNRSIVIESVDFNSLFGSDLFTVGTQVDITSDQVDDDDVFTFPNGGLELPANTNLLLQPGIVQSGDNNNNNSSAGVGLQSMTIRITDDAPGLAGDFDMDDDVDADDIDFYSGNLGMPAMDDLAQLDLNGDNVVTLADHDLHVMTLVQINGVQSGTLIGDINLDGQVDVLMDAFILINNLGTNATGWASGDLNADQTVDVLGDAFLLVNNLGQSITPAAP